MGCSQGLGGSARPPVQNSLSPSFCCAFAVVLQQPFAVVLLRIRCLSPSFCCPFTGLSAVAGPLVNLLPFTTYIIPLVCTAMSAVVALTFAHAVVALTFAQNGRGHGLAARSARCTLHSALRAALCALHSTLRSALRSPLCTPRTEIWGKTACRVRGPSGQQSVNAKPVQACSLLLPQSMQQS